jgi:hypothetical protein
MERRPAVFLTEEVTQFCWKVARPAGLGEARLEPARGAEPEVQLQRGANRQMRESGV